MTHKEQAVIPFAVIGLRAFTDYPFSLKILFCKYLRGVGGGQPLAAGRAAVYHLNASARTLPEPCKNPSRITIVTAQRPSSVPGQA